MFQENKGFSLNNHGPKKGTVNPLRKLQVDRDEVSRVLDLWKQATHPEAANRIREFQNLLDSIEQEIREIEGGGSQT